MLSWNRCREVRGKQLHLALSGSTFVNTRYLFTDDCKCYEHEIVAELDDHSQFSLEPRTTCVAFFFCFFVF